MLAKQTIDISQQQSVDQKDNGATAAPTTPMDSRAGTTPVDHLAGPPAAAAATSSTVPVKKIKSTLDLQQYLESDALQSYLGFVVSLSQSVKGKTLREDVTVTATVQKMLAALDRLNAIFEQTPPDTTQKGRFGNVAFRTFIDRVDQAMAEVHRDLVPEEYSAEVGEYLRNSFGDRTRIDYGTGHEANFVTWICIELEESSRSTLNGHLLSIHDKIRLCLQRLGLLTQEDYPALVLKVFYAYLKLMRRLQFSYWLEPAGSHGVWGLDDYHFVPFLWGSAQLIDHKYIKPKSIHDNDVIEECSKDFMYLGCIKFINEIKTASLRWHSPMLDDISGVKVWSKVNEGLIKMYKGEVLSKLPIMQHYLFGSLVAFEPSEVDEAQLHHRHHHHEHGQSCQSEKTGPLPLSAMIGGRPPVPYASPILPQPMLHEHAYVDVFGVAPTCCPRMPSAVSAHGFDAKKRAMIPFD